MKIKHQISISVVATSIVAVILTSLVTASVSVTASSRNTEDLIAKNLKAQREQKSDQIQTYFNNLEKQLKLFAGNPFVKEALTELSAGFSVYAQESNFRPDGRLKSYYGEDFGGRYTDLNGQPVNTDGLLSGLNTNARALQHAYIAANPAPLGEKDTMKKAATFTYYDSVHQMIHPAMRQYLQTYGLYDVFLVSAAGDVVYTVFKELDYATSLTEGPYKDSGLARAYHKALPLQPGEVVFDDFAPYLPSYDSPAAFLATPVTTDNRTTGVLIIQLPIDGISHIMSNHEKWKESGLGETGDNYLVGSDSRLRSDLRALLESPESALRDLAGQGASEPALAAARSRGTSVGIIEARTTPVRSALQGESGIMEITDIFGKETVTAFGPLTAFGQNWALISQVDKDEAYATVYNTTRDLITYTLISSLLIAAAGTFIALWLGRSISHPITVFIRKVSASARDHDVTSRFAIRGADEFQDLSNTMNDLMDGLQQFMLEMHTTSDTLNQQAQSLAQETHNTSERVNRQNGEVNLAATATAEVSASVTEVANHADQAASRIRDTRQRIKESNTMSTQAREKIRSLGDNMKRSEEAIGILETESDSIGAVLDVIQTIAEQTNLLALNAAIEAARAGEQGRGFAVVADEVRTLASRTATSTEDIRSRIQSLQNQVVTVRDSIRASGEDTRQSLERIEHTASNMDEIAVDIDGVEEMSTQIAAAAEEQSAVSREIERNVSEVKDLSDDILHSAASIGKSSNDLSQIASQIRGQLQQFRFGN